jgi:aspartyl-tRNA(Asn)/glutamyl-tRNA(Gln) amidotransferase subunit C
VITDDEIRALARLARVRVPDEDVPALRDQLERILGYVRGLAEVDVTDVEPFIGPRDEPTRLRADDPQPPLDPALALRSAARHDDAHVLVPRFVDEG